MVFNRPIGMNQGIQFPLADSLAHLDAAELVLRKATWLYDSGKPCGREANTAKYLCAEAGFAAADRAVQTHGGMGYSEEYHVARYFREARSDAYRTDQPGNDFELSGITHFGNAEELLMAARAGLFDLTGRSALVTGAAGGIGSAVAEAYAAAGAGVLVTDVNGDAAAKVAARIDESGGKADSFELDVTDRDAADEAVAARPQL